MEGRINEKEGGCLRVLLPKSVVPLPNCQVVLLQDIKKCTHIQDSEYYATECEGCTCYYSPGSARSWKIVSSCLSCVGASTIPGFQNVAFTCSSKNCSWNARLV